MNIVAAFVAVVVAVVFAWLLSRLHAKQSALDAEEALLIALTETLIEGVFVVDATHRVVRVNDKARQLLGVTAVVPFPASTLPGDAKLVRALEAVRVNLVPESGEVQVGDRTLSLSVRRLPDGGAVFALFDLTTLRRLEAVRRDFVANVSHELRTPLTIMRGVVETLQDDTLTDDARTRFVAMTESTVHRMQRIVDDLLDLSRIESGGWMPRPVTMHVQTMAIEALAPLQDAAKEKGVVIGTDIAPNATQLLADETAIHQVLSNLAENALRHTMSGSVTVIASREENGVWIGVSDTGTGIAPEQLPRIFERFYRADPGRSREAGGTGLGLAIVKHLAEAHGGTVRATSKVGEGTTIEAYFPDQIR